MESKVLWEYKTFKSSANRGFLGGKTDDAEIADRLNELGAQGWELVTSFVTHIVYGSSREVNFIFKRKIIPF